MIGTLLCLSPGSSSVGARLRRLRLARGMSLAQAAAAGNVSKSALAHWESGRRIPPGRALDAFLDLFAVEEREKASLLALADPRYARLALADAPRGPAASVGEVLRAMRLRRELHRSIEPW